MTDYWEENGIEKPQAIIVCAACRFEDFIICGARHWDSVMRMQYDVAKSSKKWEWHTAPPEASQYEQGFINQFGEFLTREEAMQAVKESGQPLTKYQADDKVLFSEGLY